MTLSDLTEPKLLVTRLLSDRHTGVVREMSRRLEATGRIANAQAFETTVLKRETEFPTIIAEGFATPHARGQAVDRLSMAVGYSASGVSWSEEGARVHLVFLFAVPITETDRYLAAFSALTHFLQDEANVAALKNCRQPEEMLRLLARVHIPEPDQALLDQ